MASKNYLAPDYHASVCLRLPGIAKSLKGKQQKISKSCDTP